MTFWEPDTCNCRAHVETEKLIIKCKMHNTYQETLKHNQSFNKMKKPFEELQRLKLKAKIQT